MAFNKHLGQPSPYKWSMPSFAVTNLEQALISAVTQEKKEEIKRQVKFGIEEGKQDSISIILVANSSMEHHVGSFQLSRFPTGT